MPKSIRVAIMDYMALDKKDLLTSVILRDLFDCVEDRYLLDTIKLVSEDFDLTDDIKQSENIINSEVFFIAYRDEIFNLMSDYVMQYNELPLKEFNTDTLVQFVYIYTIFLLNEYLENQTLIEEV